MKSLATNKHQLASAENQIEVLTNTLFPKFEDKLSEQGLFPLHPENLEVFQINVGKMCNQTCKHCHVDAGPDRKEIMNRETMLQCIEAIKKTSAHTIDLTGGAPEMNPEFRWFVEQLSGLGKKIIVRCNLTIIVANKKYNDLPEFFKLHKVEVVSSLPYFTATKTDSQRGNGVFEKSIRALKMLNDVGYGIHESGLILNLVYNPSGAFLPSDEMALEKEFKQKLKTSYNIEFNNLFALTNLPISRFLEYLIRTGNYEGYMDSLISAFNPIAAENVMCRSTLSIGWDGFVYDCDFNQMLEMKVAVETEKQHISSFNADVIHKREIKVGQHCFGCTAGSGSSCSGNII